MKKTLRIYQVDAFTNEKFKGNPAGVVANADGLTEQEMLNIARELNNSETAFILSADDASHDVHIRYFTPTTEVPICGHATIAAHYVRSIENQLPTSTVYSKSQIGILPIHIEKRAGDYAITMEQGEILFNDPLEVGLRLQILDALHLTELDLDPSCHMQIFTLGLSKVIIGIKSRTTLNQLSPDLVKLSELSEKINCNGFFIFTFDSPDEGILTHARMFAPAIGIDEDPVTGVANAPLGAYLIKHQLVEHDGKQFSFYAEQGSAMGRSGQMTVTVDIENNEPIHVQIKGNAVIVFKTECTL